MLYLDSSFKLFGIQEGARFFIGEEYRELVALSPAAYKEDRRRFLTTGIFVSCLSVAGIVIYLSPMLGVALVSVVGLYLLLSKHLADFAFLLAFSLIAGAMVTLEMIQFTFFSQAEYLLARQADPLQLLVSFDLWGPRYLLAYPAVLLADRFALDLDLAFTIYSLFGLTVVIFLIVKYCELAKFFSPATAGKHAAQIILGGAWLALCPFMNGRLIIAFAGISLLLCGQVYVLHGQKFTPGAILLQTAGVFLALMTTGTVMVAFGQMLLGGFLINRTLPKNRRLRGAAVVVILLSLGALLPFIYKGMLKNIPFFGGSIISMLRHGLGQMFFLEEALSTQAGAALFLAGLAALLIGQRLRRRNPFLLPAWLCIPVALFLGLFGYSTMLMFLPSLMILGVYLVLHIASAAIGGAPIPQRAAPCWSKNLSI